jgi:hypothetical protein
MPLYLRLFLPLLLYSFCVSAQDTIRTIVTDTSIIYVIKKAPVTIVRKVEVDIAPEKQKLLLSVGASYLHYWQRTSAKSGNEEYLKLVNDHTSTQPGYEFHSEIFKYYKLFYLGIDLHFSRTKQKFTFANSEGKEFSANNRFNYFGTSVYGGYVLAKTRHYKMIPCLGFQMNKLTSYSGYTVNKADYTQPVQLISEMKYKARVLNIVIGIKNLVRIKKLAIEAQPFFMITPMSFTDKNEVYKLWRSYAGLKIGFITPLF